MFRLIQLSLLGAMCVYAFSAAALEDPTRPPGYGITPSPSPEAQKPRWRLLSTLVAPGRRVANINGQLVHQGEEIGGAKLVQVSSTKVVLQHQGRRFTLSLLPNDFKRTHGAR